MNIDIRTLILVTGITHCIQILVLIYQYAVNRRYPGIGWWLLWSAAEVVGFAFMLLREIPSILRIAIIGQNSLIVSGVLFLYVGIMRFFEKRESRWIPISIFAIFLAGLLFFLYAHDDIQARSVIIAATLAVIAFISARATLVHRPRSVTTSANFLAAVFLVHGGYFGYRALMFVAGTPATVFAPTPLNIAAYLDALIAGILFTICLIVMINQRLNADMAEAKEHFELIFNTSPDAALITRLTDGLIVDINRGFTALMGFTRDDAIGKSSLDIHIWEHPADRQKFVNELQEKGIYENFEAIFRRKDGNRFTGLMSATITNLRGRRHIISVTRDITASKWAEQRYQSLFDGVPIGLFRTTPEGKVLAANPALARLLGYDDVETLKKKNAISFYLDPRDRERWKALIEHGGSIADIEFPLRRRDGEVIWGRENARAVRDASGKVLYYEGSLENITERKLAEDALRASEENYRSLLTAVVDAVILSDARGELQLVNDPAQVLFRRPESELVGKRLAELLPGEVAGPLLEAITRVANARAPSVHVNWFRGRYLESVLSPVQDDAGEVSGVTIVARDITDRRQADEQIVYQAQLLEGVNDATVATDNSYRVTFWNPAAERTYGWKAEEALGKNIGEVIRVRAPIPREEIRRIVRETGAWKGTAVHFTRDGRELTVEWSVALIRDASGAPIGTVSINRDVTDRAATQAALQESEERFRNLMEYIPGIAIQGYHLDGTIFYWNRASTVVYGYSAGEALGRNLGDLIVPPELKPLFSRCLALGRVAKKSGEFIPPGELSLLRKDGTRVSVYSIHTAICVGGKEPMLFCIDVDLSERKRVEEALEEKERFYRALFQLSPSGILLEDSGGRIIDANPTVCRDLGYSREELLNLRVHDLAHPDSRDGVDANLARILSGETLQHVVRNRRKDGSVSCMELFETKFPLADGRGGILVLSNDISQRMETEAELRDSEERYRNLFDISQVGIFLLNPQGNVVSVNSRGAAIYGYSPEEMLDKNISGIVPRKISGNFPRLVENAKKRRRLFFRSEGKDKEGKVFPVELTVSLFHWKGEELIQVLVQDITEQKQADEAERLRKLSEALMNFQEEERKQLARDLHDHLGQDMAAIKISLEILKGQLPESGRHLQGELTEIVKLCDKVIADVRRISASLRPASLDELGLVPCLRHEIEYLASRSGLEIQLDARRLAGRLPPDREIAVYRIIQEAITNVIKHARAKQVSVVLARRGRMLRLTVSDDGRGFNLKPGKKGTGLGLLGMRERVAAAGGSFNLTSRPGKGTRLAITLSLP